MGRVASNKKPHLKLSNLVKCWCYKWYLSKRWLSYSHAFKYRLMVIQDFPKDEKSNEYDHMAMIAWRVAYLEKTDCCTNKQVSNYHASQLWCLVHYFGWLNGPSGPIHTGQVATLEGQHCSTVIFYSIFWGSQLFLRCYGDTWCYPDDTWVIPRQNLATHLNLS